jgi:hypothetical protein
MLWGSEPASVKICAARAVTVVTLGLLFAMAGCAGRQSATAGSPVSGNAARSAPAAFRTFYVDFEGGSEANSGGSEGSPWKRAPGMRGFEHAYSHEAGDHFVFKGGVTWPNGVFPLNVTGEGTPSTEDYYGVKESWFVGSSYSRPVFDAEGKEIGGHDGNDNYFINEHAGGENRSYITVEGIHFKGFNAENPSGAYGSCAGIYFRNGMHNVVNNVVFNEFQAGDSIEEWADGANKTSEEARCTAIAGEMESSYFGKDESLVENSTIEGLPPSGEEPGGNFFEGIRNVPNVKNTIIKRMTQLYFPAIGGGVITGDHFEDCGWPDWPRKYKGTLHSNAVEVITLAQEPVSAVYYEHPYYISNNVWRGMGSGGHGGTAECEAMSMEQGVYYVWNNVVTKTEGNPFLLETENGSKNQLYMWNNSLEGSGFGSGGCLRRGHKAEIGVLVIENNFCDSKYSTFQEEPESIKAKTTTEKANLIVAPSELASKHYETPEEPLPFAPTSAAAPGVGKGEALTSQCSGALTSLCEDTTYAGARSALSRPPSEAWDLGAYEW